MIEHLLEGALPETKQLAIDPPGNRRTWDTPTREPWNPVIKQCLNAIDEHMRLHFQTGNTWHADQAETLRKYVLGLKVWIHSEEKGYNPDISPI